MGKGSWSRVSKTKQYQENHDKIFGDKNKNGSIPEVHSTEQVRPVETGREETGNMGGDSTEVH